MGRYVWGILRNVALGFVTKVHNVCMCVFIICSGALLRMMWEGGWECKHYIVCCALDPTSILLLMNIHPSPDNHNHPKKKRHPDLHSHGISVAKVRQSCPGFAFSLQFCRKSAFPRSRFAFSRQLCKKHASIGALICILAAVL